MCILHTRTHARGHDGRAARHLTCMCGLLFLQSCRSFSVHVMAAQLACNSQKSMCVVCAGKRLAIGAALIPRPAILFADEPTSGESH